ncbi:MAG: BglG family transcription antiterminator [Firmicutes bacterium]|nr:BglG family transcription antiterminator [Bacillota bacterium]
MQLSKRQKELLRCLLNVQNKMSASTLATQFSVSPRTIRYDLQAIADALGPLEGIDLYRQPREGIWIQSSEKVRKDIFSELGIISSPDFLSPQERQQIITAELLTATTPITFRHLETVIDYSESTLAKDLDHLEPWFEQRKLVMIRRPNYGLEVRGQERWLREAIIDFISEVLTPEDIRKLFSGLTLKGSLGTYISQLLSSTEVESAVQVVRNLEGLMDVRFSDIGFINLTLYLSVSCNRLRLGNTIKLNDRQLSGISIRKEYHNVQKATQPFAAELGIRLTDEEVALLTLKLISSPRRVDSEDRDELIGQMTVEIATVAEGLLGVNLVGDKKFLHDLAQHLKPTINRIEENIHIENPLLAGIEQRFPAYMEAATVAAGIIQKYLNNKVSDHEVGFIALHIGAVIERHKQIRQSRIKAVVVCSSGLGTSNILAARLKQEFPELTIIACASMFEADSVTAESNPDIVISTIPLTLTGTPVAVIDPLLPEQHISLIRSLLSVDSDPIPEPPSATSSVSETILDIIEKYAMIIDRNGLREQIIDLLATLEFARERDISPTQTDHGLLKFLKPDTVEIVQGHTDWKQLVHATGNLLISVGAADRGYSQRMLEQIIMQGPYMVMTQGIALLHAPAGPDIRHAGFALVVCPHGVNFDHPKFDPVKLVFAFCSPDKDTHLVALKQLMQVIADKELVIKLSTATDKNDAFKLIQTKLGGVRRDRN